MQPCGPVRSSGRDDDERRLDPGEVLDPPKRAVVELGMEEVAARPSWKAGRKRRFSGSRRLPVRREHVWLLGVASARMLDPSTAPASSVPIERGRRAERDTRISPFPISLWRAYPASDLTERVGKGVDRNRFFEPPGRLTEPGSVPIVGLGARAAAPEGGKPGAQSERVGHAPERPHPNARGCLAPPPLAAYLPRYRARNP